MQRWLTQEATLDPSQMSPCVPAGYSAPSSLPPLRVTDYRLNAGNNRELWPWKADAKFLYYEGRVFCRDSDAFPGLDVEGVMEYDDTVECCTLRCT